MSNLWLNQVKILEQMYLIINLHVTIANGFKETMANSFIGGELTLEYKNIIQNLKSLMSFLNRETKFRWRGLDSIQFIGRCISAGWYKNAEHIYNMMGKQEDAKYNNENILMVTSELHKEVQKRLHLFFLWNITKSVSSLIHSRNYFCYEWWRQR